MQSSLKVLGQIVASIIGKIRLNFPHTPLGWNFDRPKFVLDSVKFEIAKNDWSAETI